MMVPQVHQLRAPAPGIREGQIPDATWASIPDKAPSTVTHNGHVRRRFARGLFFNVAEITLSGPSIPPLGEEAPA